MKKNDENESKILSTFKVLDVTREGDEGGKLLGEKLLESQLATPGNEKLLARNYGEKLLGGHRHN